MRKPPHGSAELYFRINKAALRTNERIYTRSYVGHRGIVVVWCVYVALVVLWAMALFVSR